MVAILEQPFVRKVALPITVEQYHTLGEAGLINEKVELLRGVIVEKMSKSPLHTWTVRCLVQLVERLLGDSFVLRKEEPLTFADSEPEPDLAVVGGRAEDFRLRHTSMAEIVFEVSVSTQELDREKASVYANAGVKEYWIIRPEEKQIDVYRDPSSEGYKSVETFSEGQVIESQAIETARLFN